MNAYQLAFREFSPTGLPLELSITRPATCFKQVRHAIKPFFTDQSIQFNNENGYEAQSFGRRISRFKSDWLEFTLPNYQFTEADYPSDAILEESRFTAHLENSEIDYLSSIKEETAKQNAHLFAMIQISESSREKLGKQYSFRLNGIPESEWPLDFVIDAFIITNAPSSLWVYYRHTILL